MDGGEIVAGAIIALTCFLFGKHEDEILKFIKNKLRDFNQTTDPQKKREIASQLKNDPAMQEFLKLIQEEK